MGKGQTSSEFCVWATEIPSLAVEARNIKQVSDSSKPNDYLNQCEVLKILIDFTAEIVEQWWIDDIEEVNSASEVGRQLLGVLKRGLQLLQQCAEDEKSRGCRIVCAGEFFEIIDDVEMYSQMMNKLAKEQVSKNLQHKVQKYCMMMRDALRAAVDGDRTAMLIYGRPCIGLENEISSSEISIQSNLGFGRFGTVSKALWRDTPVAVKEFFYESDFDKEYSAFKQLGTLESSHVIQIFGHSVVRHGDYGYETASRKALVMELMDLDLKKLISLEKKKRPDSSSLFSVYKAIDIMLQIAKGAMTVCRRGMSHRDMKPSNILVKLREDGSFVVKLADFGIAGKNNEPTDEKVGEQPDVYSFGLICLEILTGSPPQSRSLAFDSYEASLPQHIPEEINDIIRSCMHIDAKYRPTFSGVYDDLLYLKEMVLIAGIDMQRYNDEEDSNLLPPAGIPELPEKELHLDAIDMSNGLHRLIVLHKTHCLGSGTCGSVWKAVWGERQVAVKMFSEANDFEREFALLKATSSSHVIQLLGHLENRGKKGLIMEFMDMDLRRLIEETMKTSPLSFYGSADILLQIAKGACSLHEADLIHRDIKPSNVLLKRREDGTFLIKLADFNTSKANFQTKNSNSNNKGTPLYMAPEMVAATSKYSKNVDVYSFGILCIQILTGRMNSEMRKELEKGQVTSLLQADPMEPKDKKKKMIEDSSKKNTSLPRIPKDYQKIICSCLELEPQKRPNFKELCSLLGELKEKYKESPAVF